MSLSTKIFYFNLLVTFSILVGLGYVLHTLRAQEDALVQDFNRIQKVNRLNTQLERLQDITDTNTLAYQFNPDAALITQTAQAQFEKAKILDEMSPLVADDAQRKELLKDYIDTQKYVESSWIDLIAAIQLGDNEAIQTRYESWQDINTRVRASLTALNEYNLKLLDVSYSKIQEVRTRVTQLVLIVGTVMVFGISTRYYFIKRKLIDPIYLLLKHTRHIAQGHFERKLSYKNKDEIGALFENVNVMADKLKRMYGNLEEEVEERTREFRKFKLAVDSATDGIVITTPEGNITYVNDAWQNLTGYSLKEVVGQNPRVLKSGKSPSRLYEHMWSNITRGRRFKTEELINRKKDGEEYYAKLQIFPVTEEDKVIFFVGIEEDISERKRVEQAKTDFIGVASHQLKTPLGIVRWGLDLLFEEPEIKKLSKESRDTLKIIYETNVRMSSLINDFLNVSRIDQGRVKSSPESTSVAPVLEKVIGELAPLAKERGIIVETNIKSKSGILVDPNHLHEVLINIIGNAVKYNKPQGKVVISVTEKPHWMSVQVQDTGIGIEKENIDKLFTKFYRAPNATQFDPHGSGLGLYVVKSYVESWGGKISVKSMIGKGTTFTLLLPVRTKKL